MNEGVIISLRVFENFSNGKIYSKLNKKEEIFS